MRCGLFGKLSAKRDFIAISTPRPFLEMWEPWVQACMSASQHELGTGWQAAYLTAPLWRFWLGAELAGVTAMGVFMPSVDGVGRYYPLTLLAVAAPSMSVPPPDLDAQNSWFAAAEEFLLSTLDRERSFDQISATLDALPAPRVQPTAGETEQIVRLSDESTGLVSAGKSFQAALASLRETNHALLAAASFWWTEGGGDFPPMALSSRGLPDPFRYSTMLTGKLPAQDAHGA